MQELSTSREIAPGEYYIARRASRALAAVLDSEAVASAGRIELFRAPRALPHERDVILSKFGGGERRVIAYFRVDRGWAEIRRSAGKIGSGLIFVLIVVIIFYCKALGQEVILPTKSSFAHPARFIDVLDPTDKKKVIPGPIGSSDRIRFGVCKTASNSCTFVRFKAARFTSWKVYSVELPREQHNFLEGFAHAGGVGSAPGRQAVSEDNFRIGGPNLCGTIPNIEHMKPSGHLHVASFRNLVYQRHESYGEFGTVRSDINSLCCVGRISGGSGGLRCFCQRSAYMPGNSTELVRMSSHGDPLKNSYHNEQECKDSEEGVANPLGRRFVLGVLVAAFFGPVAWWCGKLIVDDNRRRLGYSIIGAYLTLIGVVFLLIYLTDFRWSWGWWL